MKIGLFGGSFNPITKGHILVANNILNTNINLSEIWFMPCNINKKKKLVKSKHRINMINIAIKSSKKLKLFDYEIKNNLPNDTLNTIKLLNKSKYSVNNKFYFIIGLDVANNLIYWNNYKELINIINFIVIPRKNYIIKNKWFFNDNHIFLSNINIDDISSS